MTLAAFRELARVFPEPLFLISGDGHILAVNPPFAHLLAKRSDMLVGTHLTDLVVNPPEQVATYLGACARSRALVLGSLTFRTGDGRLVTTRSEGGVMRPRARDMPAHILIRLQPQESASQQFLLLTNKIDELSREIRARRRAEEELARQREHLRVTLASIGDAVIVTNAQGQISFINPIAERLTGWDQDTALGQPLATVFRIVSEATHAEVENPVVKVLRAGTIVGLANHTLLIAKDGTEYPIDDSAAPIVDGDGDVIGVVLVFRDVTERRRAELRQHFLAEASAALARPLEVETTFDHIARMAIPMFADLCWIDSVQLDGRIERVAVAGGDTTTQALLLQAQFHKTDASHSLYSPTRVITTGDVVCIPDLADAVQGTATDDPHLRLLADIGMTSLLCVPFTVRSGIIGAITWVTANPTYRYTPQDVTVAIEFVHRCAIVLDNAQLYHQAQEAIQLRDVFLSVASHELKTPLTSLLGSAQLLQRRMARTDTFSPASKHAIDVIAEQASRLSQMITTLLDISRIEQGQLALTCQPLDLGGLIEHVIAEVQPTLEIHTVVWEAPVSPLVVVGDALRLEQVFQNLIANAIKYSPAGGPVELRAGQDTRQVWISVTDDGIGIPLRDRPYLFQRFYRASNVDSQHISGLGIGLFIVSEIVALHGGTLTVASTEGAGSTFTVFLPRATDEEAARVDTRKQAEAIRPSDDGAVTRLQPGE